MSSLKLPEQPLQPFNVLAFDPGGTTGWGQAVLTQQAIDINMEDFNNVTIGAIELRTGEFGPKEHHEDLYEVLRVWEDNASEYGLPRPEVVSEPFHFRQHMDNPRHKVELISCEYIGVIRLACAQLGLTYYDRFTPGEAKRWTTDRKLELLGWLQTPITPNRHQNDALRQLVKYLIVKKGVRHPLTTTWRESVE